MYIKSQIFWKFRNISGNEKREYFGERKRHFQDFFHLRKLSTDEGFVQAGNLATRSSMYEYLRVYILALAQGIISAQTPVSPCDNV